MNPIGIFYHIYQVNNWESIFEEQTSLLLESDILDSANFLHLSVTGTIPLTISPGLKRYENKLIITYDSVNWAEMSTLKKLHEYAKNSPEFNILYFHTKAVTYYNHPNYLCHTDWRKYMGHFVITKWRNAVKALETHNTYGVNLVRCDSVHKGIWHYGGNFWWARGEYIKQLSELMPTDTDRRIAERWLTEPHLQNPQLLETYYVARNSNVYHTEQRYIMGRDYE